MRWVRLAEDGSIDCIYLEPPPMASAADFIAVDAAVLPDWSYSNGAFSPPPPPPVPIPGAVSDRQFFQALALSNLITREEALAAVKTGDIPAALQAVIDGLAEAERFQATMLLAGAVEFRRDHALVEVVRLARGMTPAQVDDLFRLAGSL